MPTDLYYQRVKALAVSSKAPVLAVVVLALSALACMEQIPTVAPAVEPTANTANTSTPTPTRTARPSATSTPADEPQTATVSRAVVNVRDEPGGAVIGSVEAGDVVTVLGCVDDWCEIDDPDGYVYQGCLDGYNDGMSCEAR